MHSVRKSSFTLVMVVVLAIAAFVPMAVASNIDVARTQTALTLAPINADADTFVRQTSTTNFGQRVYLGVDGGTGIEHTFMYFTVSGIPAGATIDSVVLNVTTRGTTETEADSTTDGSTQTMQVTTSTSGWAEDSLTFASQPACGAVVGTFVPSVPSTLYQITVTSAVTGNGTFGFCIKLADETSGDGVKLHSGESVTGTGPQLVVSYTEAGVEPTAIPPTTVPGETPVPPPAPVTMIPGPDLIHIPDWATGGKVVAWTHVFYAPLQGAAGVEELAPGTSIWVYGLDSTRKFYMGMLAGKLFWLPVGVVGPNYESPWFGRPLPTQLVDMEGDALE